MRCFCALFLCKETSYRFARGFGASPNTQSVPALPVSGMNRTTSDKKTLLCLQRTGEFFDAFGSYKKAECIRTLPFSRLLGGIFCLVLRIPCGIAGNTAYSAMISNFTTPSASLTALNRSFKSPATSEISAEIVTAAHPLVGTL